MCALLTFVAAMSSVAGAAHGADMPVMTVVFGGAVQVFHVVPDPLAGFSYGFTGVTYRDVDRKRLDIVATAQADGSGSVLSLSVDYIEDHDRDGWPLTILEAQAFFDPDPAGQEIWVDEGDGPDTEFVFTHFAYDGKEGRVAGRFKARMCLVPDHNGDPDPAARACHDMGGSFDIPVLSAG